MQNQERTSGSKVASGESAVESPGGGTSARFVQSVLARDTGPGVDQSPANRAAAMHSNVCRRTRSSLIALFATAALAAPRAATAQAGDGHADAPGSAMNGELWGSPFAVESVGRPLGRDLRRIVLLTDQAGDSAPEPTPAPRTAPSPASARDPAPAREPVPARAPAPARAPVPAAAPAPPKPAARAADAPGSGTRTHRVEWGETWYGLAREFGVTASQLSAANPDIDPEHLRSGSVIRVPRSSSPSATRTHRVVPGETLWGISRRYGVTAEQLRRANGLIGDRVRIGETLVIPQEEKRP